MKLLLTGFEPFGGRNINPSERVVAALAEQPADQIDLNTAILPVDRERGPATLLHVVRETQPDAVICLGEAAGRARLSIERVAVNLLDFRIADNAGEQVRDKPIVRDGPAAYFATLPVRAMHDAIAAIDVPVELSLSAGAFLCNQVMYTLLHQLALDGSDRRAGFIHLPLLPEQAAHEQQSQPSMALATMTLGVRAAIDVLRSDPAITRRQH